MSALKDKVAVITGAGRGLGRSHALLFAQEGAKVIVNDVGCERDGSGARANVAQEVVKTIRELGGQAEANRDPVGSIDGAQRLVQSAIDAYGRIDILVNNAGILRDRTILKMSEAEWDEVIQVHLKGTFAGLQAAAKAMVAQGNGGRIINTSSSSGLLGNFGQTNYGAAKAGIHALTRIAAMELVKHKITVNAIAPWAMTRMMTDLPVSEESMSTLRLDVAGVSPLVAFLASDSAERITGQTFGIEGSRIFIYRMMTSHGDITFSADETWSIEAIGKKIGQIVNW